MSDLLTRDVYLTTKLFIPQPHPGWVLRPRLLERLDSSLSRKLALISAPAGYGKTTVVTQWVWNRGFIAETSHHRPTNDRTARKIVFTWLSLDETDNDPIRFWDYFVLALQGAFPELGGDIRAFLQMGQSQPPPDQTIPTLLINEIARLPQDLVMVLNDYHVIIDPTIQRGIAFLLDHMPPQFHLIIASRSDPPLPLARLRAKGEMLELRENDLRFTADEASPPIS